jgi:rod shape-determining protein MreC
MRLNRWALLAVAALGALVFLLTGMHRPLGDGLRRVSLPAARFLSGVAAFVGSPSASGGDAEKVAELELRLSSLSVDYVRLRALEEENRSLRAQAKFLATSGYDSVGARVISRDVRNERALLLIDRGQVDNVEVGQAVVTDEGVYVGKIVALSERVSTVELLTDPHSRVAAAFGTDLRLLGVLEGRGSGAAVLTYIPPNEGVKRDEVVVTAGTEEKIPGNVPVGIVNVVEGKPTDPFLSAAIEPLVALDRVVFVSVLRPSALRPAL